MMNLPIVCTLDPAALAARREGLLAQLVARANERRETDEGYRLQFTGSSGTLELIARTVEAERHCCRFLRFQITVEPGEGTIVLDVTGPPGSREFLAALLDA
jgi:hypothetical protein